MTTSQIQPQPDTPLRSASPSNSAGPSPPIPISLPPPHRSHPPPNNMPPPTSTVPSRKRKLAPTPPAAASPSASEESADQDGEYEPAAPPPARAATKRAKGAQASSSGARGGSSTSTTGRGMSREALRKANHSLIERRRREKINHALGELRDMVPGLGEAEGGKGGEFKLEVLERTVIHMKELKAQIADLQSRPLKSPTTSTSAASSQSTSKSSASTRKKSLPTHTSGPHPHRNSISPPTPSQSPDPNETDAESNLPPQFAVASRPPHSSSHSSSSHSPPQTSAPTPSITSLLASLPDRTHPQPSSRPAPASAQAHNPTLYLPFPTPSPTSPFLSYSHSTSASSSGPPEPSPFLAPLQGMALFGGALTLDNNILAPSPADALASRNPPVMVKDKEQEEAANLLLAFSSPDVLRPTGYMTPLFAPTEAGSGRALETEDFVLDGGVRGTGAGGRKGGGQVRGKTARDILRM